MSYAASVSHVCRVYRIHQRWASLHSRLQNDLLSRLAGKGPIHLQEGVRVMRETNATTEVRLMENNEAFRHVQDCLDWIQNKQVGGGRH